MYKFESDVKATKESYINYIDFIMQIIKLYINLYNIYLKQ